MYNGFGDQYADMHQWGSTNVDTELVGKIFEVLSKYFDEEGEVLAVWSKVEVLAILTIKEKKQLDKIN